MTMQPDPSDKTGAPMKVGPVKIEWNWDLDEQWDQITSIKVGDQVYRPSEEGRVRFKGRCKRCWGGLIAKVDGNHPPEAIRCRVCGLLLEGDAAKDEFQRMSAEERSTTFHMALGQVPKYSDNGTFVQKVFPHIDRQSETEFHQRVMAAASKGTRDGRLTRSGFPAGSAGMLFLQARALMSGVERLPREMSVARFSDFDINDDGSATVYLSKEELSEHTKTSEYELMKRLGSTMTIAMMSAFACELAMKAIRFTRMDEARKSHDLWKLYRALPQDSKERIEADFGGIVEVLKKARYTFDKWRYFEVNVSGHGISAMIDTERAFALAKAARVILDEAEMVGLGYSVNVDATQRVTKTGNQRDVHIEQHLNVKGTEAPPK